MKYSAMSNSSVIKKRSNTIPYCKDIFVFHLFDENSIFRTFVMGAVLFIICMYSYLTLAEKVFDIDCKFKILLPQVI